MAQKTTDPKLNSRAQHILKLLIQRYMSDGHPVGSKTLRASGIDLSPATIRNVMANLEDSGFLASPHSSAGRIPTERGIRFFVDTLLTTDQDALLKDQVPAVKLASTSREGLFDSASTLLSGLTHMAGLVMLPRADELSLRQLEFIPISKTRVLAIVVSNDNEVQNRIIETDREYSSQELREIAGYLNEQLAGRGLKDVREKLLADLKMHRHEMNDQMNAAINMAETLFDDAESDSDYVLAGETNLMEYAELSNVQKLKELFQAFHQKQEILKLLDQCLSAEGIQIFIGQESGYRVFDGCSLVTSTYEVDGKALGVLGVIGPARMAYDRVIPVVDMTAKLLSAALNSK